MSAQRLLDINAKEGEFHSRGMSPSRILDEVRDLKGYDTQVSTNATRESLKKAVSQGPILAVVKSKLGSKPLSSDLSATGNNHSVVVTGLSDDGQKVRVNDPWTGKSTTYSWTDFIKAWGADFGKSKQGGKLPTKSFVSIRPSKGKSQP
jgi:predicted double-glycine peptidase